MDMAGKNGLSDLALSDSGFVFDPRSGATFTVNQTGLFALKALRDGLAVGDIAARLATEFDLRGADPVRDLSEFVQMLRQNGVLTDGQGDA
jgi:hypothetical protein